MPRAPPRVRLDYRSEAGSEWVTEGDPLAGVSATALVPAGPFPNLGPRRAYRLDRSAQWTARRHLHPTRDLDPVAMLAEHLASVVVDSRS